MLYFVELLGNDQSALLSNISAVFLLRSILSHATHITMLRLMTVLSQGTLVVNFAELQSQLLLLLYSDS